jgi:hypothetical protein
VSVLLARAGILAKQTVGGGGGGGFDPAVKFDLGYGIGSDLGADASTITSWGHTLSLVENGTGLALPVVATDTGKKVARFHRRYPDPYRQFAQFGGVDAVRRVDGDQTRRADLRARQQLLRPHPGSTVSANIEAHAAFPADVNMTAGSGFVTVSATSAPGSWHVRRFRFEGATGSIEIDGSTVASGSLGGSGTLSGFHLGSGYFGEAASDYDVAAWGLASTILGTSDAAAALTYLTALMP